MIAELFRYNCSTLFILKPVVGVNWGILKSDFGLINSYLKDKAREDLNGDMLFVLFKPTDFDYFEMFLEEQSEKNLSFVEDYDYTGGYIVIVYKIPEILKPDFELFKKGQYSRFSSLIKECYDKQVVAFLQPHPTFQWGVFEKAKWLKKELEEFLETQIERGSELWNLPDIEGKEVLTLEKLEELSRVEKTIIA